MPVLHTAAELADGGGWQYAAIGEDGDGDPIGGCRGHSPHPTEADARMCYQQWRRDHITLDGKLAAAPCTHRDHNGRRCQGTATGRAQVAGERHHHAALCPEHLTRQHAIVALGLHLDQAGDVTVW